MFWTPWPGVEKIFLIFSDTLMLMHGIELKDPSQCRFGPFETFSEISEQQDPVGIPDPISVSFAFVIMEMQILSWTKHFFYVEECCWVSSMWKYKRYIKKEQHNLNGILNIFIRLTSQLLESNCFLSSLAKIEISKEWAKVSNIGQIQRQDNYPST